MIRKLARPALASVYIADGADTLMNTAKHVEATESVLNRTRSLLPRKYARQVPQDPELVARAVGGAKVGAGSLLALGKLPRLSATTLALLAMPTIVGRHAFWETQDPQEKNARRKGFLTDVALLGGLGITSLDNGGKPGLTYRASEAVKSATTSANESGSALKEYVEENKDDWLATARENAEAAKKKVVKAAAKAQDKAEAAANSKKAAKFQKRATKALKKAQKKLKNFEF
ncbi:MULTISPECIES: DoxX family protein [unclassified Corynebacterium]|uniref:DoxX family protein n=1 Tax=unclassified Corynebacterium TaxID=2624378 RepID=UPI0029CA6625|nr:MULTISPECIES: DoxX family protein [unclassified Corynebacterium]WPF67098.1 DoxX family protein [Corynebacterium sp. 22KM0430]WPF69586.1 DoxX family protein [Corynebacterium sp. 21KM1197]